MEKYGITKEEAIVRTNSLTDEEVMEIAGKLGELPAAGFFNIGKFCTESDPECGGSSKDGGAVLVVIGIIVLVGLFIYWFFFRNKAKVDSPSSEEGPASVPVEEDCDMEIESCD